MIGGGTPLADAVAFRQWRAARWLVERGARTKLWEAAGLGLMGRVEAYFAGDEMPAPAEVTAAFGVRATRAPGAAEYLLGRGADLNWIPGWERLMPLDAARRGGSKELVEWLRAQGAKSAEESA